VPIDDAFKAATTTGSDLASEIVMSKSKGEFIFLLDRSGSMSGIRIEKAKEALIFFLKSLPSDSYFNVVSFGTNFSFLSKKPLKVSN